MIVVALVVLAVLTAGALALEDLRGRAAAALAALVMTPVLLVAHVWDTPSFASLRDRPALLAAAGVGGLAVVAGLAGLFARRPQAFGLAAVFALPFRVPIELGGTTANLLVPLYAVISAGVLAWAVPAARRRDRAEAAALFAPGGGGGPTAPAEEAPRGALERLLGLVLVLYAVGAAWSSDVGRAVESLVFFYVPFALLTTAVVRVRWTDATALRALEVLVGLAVVFAVIGFVEYGTRTLLLNPKVIASNQFEEYFRVNSLFFDPNIYGRFLVVVMLALAGVVAWARRGRDVAVAGALLAVLWAGLVLTISQSSFVSLLVGLLVLAALRWDGRKVLGIAAALLVAGVAVVLVAGSAVRVDPGDSKGLDEATSGRAALIEGGARLFADAPLAGQGSGAFAREYRRKEDASGERATSASHTIPLTVAAEQGVLGLAAYLALVGAALRRLLGGGARRSLARSVVGAAFVALLAHTMMYAAFLEDPLTWLLLGVGTALRRGGPDAV